MSALPFRRIAISSLAAIKHPGDPVSGLVEWTRLALIQGADAVMFRENLSEFEWQDLMESMVQRYGLPGRRPFVLLVNGAVDASWPVDGFHFRENIEVVPAGLKPKLLVGKSTHSIEEAVEAQKAGFDYLFFSPIFATGSHPNVEPVGVKALHTVCSLVKLPVFALGGVSSEREQECLDAGAWGTAAINRYL
jgi:thiamine-phosphate pyrophosphorylase